MGLQVLLISFAGRFLNLGLTILLFAGSTASGIAATAMPGATITEIKGSVQVSRAGSLAWDSAQINQVLEAGDRLRTAELARAILRNRDATVVTVNEVSACNIVDGNGRTVIELLRGAMSFFHRDAPGDIEVRYGGVSAIIKGTEFTVTVDASKALELVLFDGKVSIENPLGKIEASSGDVIFAETRSAPRRTLGNALTNRAAVQWILTYPAILEPSDVSLTPEQKTRWDQALNLYKSGAFIAALEIAQTLGPPTSPAEYLLQAALRLASSDVPGFEQLALQIPDDAPEARFRAALQETVRAVQFLLPAGSSGELSLEAPLHKTATEALAASYRLQSQGRLRPALEAARRATVLAPDCGFAHARLAELEFAFGHLTIARSELAQARRLSPKHASALGLDGFVLAAESRFPEALVRFNEAIALDPMLADAWLGRGLIRFRSGDRSTARFDLETAAALQPLRAVLRSYLAKSFAEEGLDAKAFEELARAQQLDPLDPTTPLYSALLHYRRYELASGIRDLESSIELNKNRSIYRSGLLLDQDAAVRSANLANLYELAEMSDVSRRESSRAVMSDYTSHSAHLNLASSFNALRDPTRFNLRNETAWFNEHLLASLLAPTDGATLSQNLSQNEYSRLFARNRLGLNTTTEYFGSGEWRQLASQVGNSSKFSYALDLDFHSRAGFYPNEDFTRIEWYTRAKTQITPQDSLLVLTKYQDFKGGDLFQYTIPSKRNPDYRVSESQAPIALGGWHREWTPESHTLFLGGRLQAEQHLEGLTSVRVAFPEPETNSPFRAPMRLKYGMASETYTAELCHIFQSDRHTTIAGLRFQDGQFDGTAALDSTPSNNPILFEPINQSSSNDTFRRESAYLYHTWEVFSDLRLTSGLSYDEIAAPQNFRRPPLIQGTTQHSGISPKAALVYSPTAIFALRSTYTESLGGVSFDESIRLEPTQLAGFPQAFRTLISESLIGSVESPKHRSAAIGVDLRLPTQTYLSFEGISLASRLNQTSGYFQYRLPPPSVQKQYYTIPASYSQEHRYLEQGIRFTANQILAEEWFAQGSYQFTQNKLDSNTTNIPNYTDDLPAEANLNSIRGSLLYQRKDGWFTRASAIWHIQDRQMMKISDHEDFFQINLFFGYRLSRHRGEMTIGILNLNDKNYGLSPLTPYEELPRERMIYLRIRLQL